MPLVTGTHLHPHLHLNAAPRTHPPTHALSPIHLSGQSQVNIANLTHTNITGDVHVGGGASYADAQNPIATGVALSEQELGDEHVFREEQELQQTPLQQPTTLQPTPQQPPAQQPTPQQPETQRQAPRQPASRQLAQQQPTTQQTTPQQPETQQPTNEQPGPIVLLTRQAGVAMRAAGGGGTSRGTQRRQSKAAAPKAATVCRSNQAKPDSSYEEGAHQSVKAQAPAPAPAPKAGRHKPQSAAAAAQVQKQVTERVVWRQIKPHPANLTPIPLEVGVKVFAKWMADPKPCPPQAYQWKNQYSPGVITSIAPPVCSVTYEDGVQEDEVLLTSLKVKCTKHDWCKPMHAPAPASAAAPAAPATAAQAPAAVEAQAPAPAPAKGSKKVRKSGQPKKKTSKEPASTKAKRKRSTKSENEDSLSDSSDSGFSSFVPSSSHEESVSSENDSSDEDVHVSRLVRQQ